MGSAAAEAASLRVVLHSPDGSLELWTYEESLPQEIGVGGVLSAPLRIPNDRFTSTLDQPYRLEVLVSPSSDRGQLEGQRQHLQLEIAHGTAFDAKDIPWLEAGTPRETMFKGRDRELDALVRHLKSRERINTPLLFGLTRTGKSSILDFLDVRLHLQPTEHEGATTRFFVARWHFGEAAAQPDQPAFWRYLLDAGVRGDGGLLVRLRREIAAGRIPAAASDSSLPTPLNRVVRADSAIGAIVAALAAARLYPVFMIDEFSFFRDLVDKKLADSAFLSVVREMAIGGMSSFIFAGTYDVRHLVKDIRYGITAQLANVLKRRISQIDPEPARELVGAMGQRLRFSQDATEQILRLSFRIPYFIQLICRKCALYALANGRCHLGALDVETVVACLTEERAGGSGDLERLSSNTFLHNMYNPHAPDHDAHEALLTTICDFQRGRPEPQPVLYTTILDRWKSVGVPEAERKLALAIRELKDRQVILERSDEGRAVYLISVDLFRRWWADQRRYLDQDLDVLKRKDGAP